MPTHQKNAGVILVFILHCDYDKKLFSILSIVIKNKLQVIMQKLQMVFSIRGGSWGQRSAL